MNAIDIELSAGVQSKRVAYYRLPKEVKEFFAKCAQEHKIIGFEYEAGSWNFGVILGDK